jgi:hypothetical protein
VKRCISSDEAEVFRSHFAKANHVTAVFGFEGNQSRPFCMALRHSLRSWPVRGACCGFRGNFCGTMAIPPKLDNQHRRRPLQVNAVLAQKTLMAAPPEQKFMAICQVTSLGYGLMPSSASPWSAAKPAGPVFSVRATGCLNHPICRATSSRKPKAPSGLVLLSILRLSVLSGHLILDLNIVVCRCYPGCLVVVAVAGYYG